MFLLYIGINDLSPRNYLFVDTSGGPYSEHVDANRRKDHEMKMRLAAHGTELSIDLKDYIRRRVHFSLGRFAGRIGSLSIRLADLNGPRGGVDKRCDIRVDVGLRQQVIVSERQANLHAAIAFAMERAERAVERKLKLACTGRRLDTAPPAEFGD